MPPIFQGSARSPPCSNLNSPKGVLQTRPPQKPREEHLNPHPWSLQLHEDARTMVPGSAGLRGPGVPSCDGNDGGDSFLWMPPKCPFPNPLPEGSCLKPAPNHPGLTGFSGKGVTSLFQGGIVSPAAPQECPVSWLCPPQPCSGIWGFFPCNIPMDAEQVLPSPLLPMELGELGNLGWGGRHPPPFSGSASDQGSRGM